MRGMTRLGITGGIGSGKSTVAGMLAAQGATIVDADAISRQATASGGRAIEALRQTFGAEFITADGALDRARMRSLVFSKPDARLQLEQIVHPIVREETAHQAREAAAAGCPCIVFDIPLLVESAPWRTQLDEVLVLDCRPETQIERVMQRNGLGRQEIEAILAQQATRSQRLHAADHVICNDGLSLLELEHLVRRLAARFGL